MVKGITTIDDAIELTQERMDAIAIAKKNIVKCGIIEGYVLYATIMDAIEHVLYGSVTTAEEEAVWGLITTDWEKVWKYD